MTDHARDDRDETAERSTRLLSHLDGALDASMLDAIQGAWSMLERVATNSPAHARAVRSRMFWESMSSGELPDHVVPPLVHDLVPEWSADAVDGDDDPVDDLAVEAEAA